MNPELVFGVIVVILVALVPLALSSQRRARARARLWDDVAPEKYALGDRGKVARWLMLAGIRGLGRPCGWLWPAWLARRSGF